MQNLVNITTKVNLCIVPIDDFTGEIYQGKIDISINEQHLQPIKKSYGMYIYTNLENKLALNSQEINTDTNANFNSITNVNNIRIKAKATLFCDYDESINLNNIDATNPILQLRLKPNRNYVYPATTSGIKFTISDKNHKPCSNVEVNAYLSDMTMFEALIDEDINTKANQAKVYNVYNNNLEYKLYKIIDDDEGKTDEYIRLGKLLENGSYEIMNSLSYNHARKEKLLKAYSTYSYDDGTVFIVFNKLYKSISKLTVEIKKTRKIKEEGFEIIENSIVDMGEIIL